jgi:hypothetical protein
VFGARQALLLAGLSIFLHFEKSGTKGLFQENVGRNRGGVGLASSCARPAKRKGLALSGSKREAVKYESNHTEPLYFFSLVFITTIEKMA